MLIHHLFYSPLSQPLYDDITIHGVGIVNKLGVFCKLCVAIFVFVSGYGLAVSTSKDIKLKDFYWHRFKKLYLNYWYIWLLFVPISVFVFGITFADTYGDHIAVKFTLDLLGLISLFGFDSYNPTWWFYSCIIVLYLIFPILFKYYLRIPYLIISIAVTIGVFDYLGIPGIGVISGYLLVFVTGMLLSQIPLKSLDFLKTWHIIVSLVLLSVYRMTNLSSNHITDTLLCVGLSFFLYKVTLWNWLSKLLGELGKHSMNMFLIHTFIFYFWFSKYIYITRNPLIIFLTLTVVSYLISVILEWIKKMIGFQKLLR